MTFLFTDIEGSTRLSQLLGAGYRLVLDEHRKLLRRIVAAHGGVEMFTEGDSFFFAFPDAAAALAACLSAQRELASHEWPDARARPRVRMGMHSGWAQPQEGEYVSPEVHRAARIADAAHGGQVLCSAATVEQAGGPPAGDPVGDASLRELGRYQLRGFDGYETLFQLVAPGLPQRFPRPRTAQAASHNLPAAASSFVGRDRELAKLATLMAGDRLITIVGAGGAGKTRLAVQVAAAQIGSCPDGVWFVDLATITDPGLVAVSVAATLGLRPEPGRPVLETVAEHAATRKLLLVLDTCDAQPAAVAALMSKLLTAGEGARVLATSREPIGLPGEVVWRIPPLSMEPGPDGGPSDAVALLADRTAAARGGRAVEPAERPYLARIAGRLDGLPLAIELAAARLRVLGAGQLAERLDSELGEGGADLLGTLDAGRAGTGAGAGRHTTLEAAVGWSYRTLRREPAQLLRALSVFARPVDLDTARWVLDQDPLDALTVLVDKSLLHAEPHPTGGNGSRQVPAYTYRMLDPIRAYAARALAGAGEEQAARDRHVAWSRDALHRAQRGPDGSPVTLSLRRLDPLADEVRAALRWSVSGGTARSGLELAGSLDQWWRERGLAREGRMWLFRLYGRAAETGEEIDPALLADAYHVHSLQAGADGERLEDLRFSEQAEQAARRAGDPGLLARVRSGRGPVLVELGRPAEAERVSREVMEFAVANRVPEDALFAVCCLARLLWQRGELAEAADLLGAARAWEAARPDVRGRRTVDMQLGMVALAREDLVAARDHVVVSLRSRMEHGFHTRACESLSAMAVWCALGGEPVTAAKLFGAVQAARATLQSRIGGYGDFWTEHQKAIREVLGDDVFDAAYADGSRLSLADAADVALAIDRDSHAELPVS